MKYIEFFHYLLEKYKIESIIEVKVKNKSWNISYL